MIVSSMFIRVFAIFALLRGYGATSLPLSNASSSAIPSSLSVNEPRRMRLNAVPDEVRDKRDRIFQGLLVRGPSSVDRVLFESGPTGQPSGEPSHQPTTQPTIQPSNQPTSKPSIPTGVKTEFVCTNAIQTYNVANNIHYLSIRACGAQGDPNECSRERNGCKPPGTGGCIEAIVPVNPGQKLFVKVGCSTGYNGTPKRGAHDNSGGGASDIRTSEDDLYSRLIVGGGGGGGGWYYRAFPGGGFVGKDCQTVDWPPDTCTDLIGGSANQTSGGRLGGGSLGGDFRGATAGSFGQGGFTNDGGNGGGGWYGGAAGVVSGGGGGSSYVIPGAFVIENTQGTNFGNGTVTIAPTVDPRPACGGWQSCSMTAVQTGTDTVSVSWVPDCNGQLWYASGSWAADSPKQPFVQTGLAVGSTAGFSIRGPTDLSCSSNSVEVVLWAPTATPTLAPTYLPGSPTPVPSLTPTLSRTAAPTFRGELFMYTGQKQNYTVPQGVFYVKIDACGGSNLNNLNYDNGMGGFISAVVPVVPGSDLSVYVGSSCSYSGCYSFNGNGYPSAGGGTDIRSQDGGSDGSTNLDSRLVVAGGAGGGGYGGAGGGLVGADATHSESTFNGRGGGPTYGGAGSIDACEAYPGSFWQGCNNCHNCGPSGCPLGGGGGGYYGGGCGLRGGGGGSSYFDPRGSLIESKQGDIICYEGFLAVMPTTTLPLSVSNPTLQPTAPTLSPTMFVKPSELSVAFEFTGAKQTFTVPPGISKIKLDMCGARSSSSISGMGGFISAVLPVTSGSILYLYVGGRNGYNGGGTGGYINDGTSNAGGGSSDIRTQDGTQDGSDASSLSSRLIVAGGGGGGKYGGLGGGSAGQEPALINNVTVKEGPKLLVD